MSDDFGTVNVRRGDRAREIEALRQRYRNHREALEGLGADAPNEHLAGEYRRLIDGIDDSVQKLDELEHRPSSADLSGAAVHPSPSWRSSPGSQPLVNSLGPAGMNDSAFSPIDEDPATPSGSSRVLLIVIAGLLVLGLIGWMIWRASSDRKAPSAIIERSPTSTVAESTASREAAPVAEPEAPSGLKVKPATADYGTIRKGTRAVRQFDVTNISKTALTLEVVRSTCRCLYYDYHPKIAAKGHETITVTVDGARAKAGTLDEQVKVKTKEDSSAGATLGIHAVIK